MHHEWATLEWRTAHILNKKIIRIIKDEDDGIIKCDVTSRILSVVLIDFYNIKRGNIFSSGTTTATSSTVTKRRKRGKWESCREKKIQTVTAVVTTTDREFNHQTSSSSSLLLYWLPLNWFNYIRAYRHMCNSGKKYE
jgi:hypothetical protein